MMQLDDKNKAPDFQARSLKLYFHLSDKLLLPVDIYPTDNLLDLRQFLSEASQLFFISSYHFEYKGQVLNEYMDVISQYDIQNEARIDIKIDPYDEKTARFHLKKVQDFMSNPYAYQNIFGNILKAVKDPQTLAEELRHLEEETQREEEEFVKRNKECSNQKKFGLTEAIKADLAEYLDLNLHKPLEKLEFIQSLTFSPYNPPPSHRKLKGDFFYLLLRTFESHDYHITACSRGFYLNSSDSKNFNCVPQLNHVFYNLLDLICCVSAHCRQALQRLMDLDLKDEYLELKPLNLYTSETKWLANPNDNDLHCYESNPTRAESAILNLHGFDPNGIRDWNEEIQMCKELPKTDLIQRLNRDKAVLKTHTDFVEAAIQGAKGIVDKYIQPLNQQDPEHQQVFVYNHIFFSYVVHTPDSFKQEKGPEASPTTSMANCDLRNLKILHRLDIPDLHLLNTAIVDYKGQRVLAQTIIPGILNTDHNQCTEFGSIDDGKTIQNSPEFNDLMKKVCEYFSLEEAVECVDDANNMIVLPASPEIKGIRGSDKKKFLLDLMRLSPRDANWIGVDNEYMCCVIRPELISHFITTKNFEAATEHIRKEMEDQKIKKPIEKIDPKFEENKDQPPDSKESKEDSLDSKDITKETKEQAEKKVTYVDYVNKIQEYIVKNGNNLKFLFNPNVFTRVNLADSSNLELQKNSIIELSTFITKQAIPTLVNELINGDIIIPCDSKSLGELFHAHGVNVRYLGKIANSFKKDAFPFLHMLFERIMLAKSLKHFMKEWFKKTPSMYHADMIAHVFNCVFGSNRLVKKLNEADGLKILNEHRGDEKDDDLDTDGKKKKKKKKGATTKKYNEFETFTSLLMQFSVIDMEAPDAEFWKLKPSMVWGRLRELCNKRYLYEMPEKQIDFEPFKYPLTKLATLRDVCVSSGIVIECKSYPLIDDETGRKGSGSDDERYKIPFKAEDVVDIIPVVKHLDPLCENSKAQIELANKLIAEGKFEEGMESLMGGIQIILNIFGPIHRDIAICYSKMANIYYKMGDMGQAIIYHKQSVKVLEKLCGVDNPQTAHAYSTLALFYYTAKNYQKAFESMLKSLYIFNTIGGEFHPDCSMIFSNLALMYQDADKQQSAINCLFEALERNSLMYGPESFKVANSYQSLALAHFDIHDFKKAIEFQEKTIYIFKKMLKPDDIRLKDSEIFLERMKKTLFDRTVNPFSPKTNRLTKSPKKQREGNENEDEKEKDKANDENEFDDLENSIKSKERERLLQRLKIAKLNAKYGFRRPGNIDYLRLLQQQNYGNSFNTEEAKYPNS